jgi:hypothetical protein
MFHLKPRSKLDPMNIQMGQVLVDDQNVTYRVELVTRTGFPLRWIVLLTNLTTGEVSAYDEDLLKLHRMRLQGQSVGLMQPYSDQDEGSESDKEPVATD